MFKITNSHTNPDIILQADLPTIESEAFAGSDVVITAPAGSYAIQWAEANNVTYVKQ